MNKFSDEEIRIAKQTRDAIINEDIEELKAVYMAGEICMWNELRKNRTDLLNWAKGQLHEEETPKMGKRMTAYRNDKVKFLRKAISIINI